ncbi:stigma-specific Stig1 family protein [Tasmannia lanceolata]|uniref:stigma-specific Stig1 family protein n=1 Tax=Tasmannia lanceolata TaxID=3420 RepID=UPI0040633C01
MATTLPLIKLVTILSIFIIPMTLIAHSSLTSDVEDEEDEWVMDDQFLSQIVRPGSRFFASKIKKGVRCHEVTNNICPGISVNKGNGLLQCCKKHCRNVLSDRNNCGSCHQKCGFGELCCNGLCTNIAHNVDHCGDCDQKCPSGVKCENGSCGYA